MLFCAIFLVKIILEFHNSDRSTWCYHSQSRLSGLHLKLVSIMFGGFAGGSDSKVSVCSAGDPSSIPGLGSAPGEGNGSPLQYSCLENAVDGGVWWATVHGVAKSRTQLSDFTFTFKEFICQKPQLCLTCPRYCSLMERADLSERLFPPG